jgi:hypothetical protein
VERKTELQLIKEHLAALEEARKVDEKVSAIVRMKCASAWASILGFAAVVGGLLSFFSETVHLAGEAALKAIIESIMK